MEDINDIRLGSTIPLTNQELQISTALERIQQEMEDINDIRLWSTIPFTDQELQISTALERIQQAEDQELRILLLCRICGINRISCVLQCGHLTCSNCAEPLVYCPFCNTPIRTKYCIYLHPPY